MNGTFLHINKIHYNIHPVKFRINRLSNVFVIITVVNRSLLDIDGY